MEGQLLRLRTLPILLAVLSCCVGSSEASRLIVFGDAIADDGLGTSPLAQAALHTTEVCKPSIERLINMCHHMPQALAMSTLSWAIDLLLLEIGEPLVSMYTM